MNTVILLQLSNDPNIVIAKMDATANDVPSPYEVRGYVACIIYVPNFLFVAEFLILILCLQIPDNLFLSRRSEAESKEI